MAVRYFYYLPIIIFVWFPATFLVTYTMAVLRKDVNPLFPYISDTGTFSPESCIFGQMLNTGAILMALFIYIRYRQVREICRQHNLDQAIQRKNKISSYFGLTGAFGVTIVGNFQETNMLVAHMFGALLAFGLGTVWECLQTWVSFKLLPTVGSRHLNYVRLTLSTIGSVSFAISFIFAGVAIADFKGNDITKWDKSDGGYEFHIVSTVTEWIVVFCIMAYILSFASGLKDVTFDEPCIYLARNVDTVNGFPEPGQLSDIY